MQMQVVEHRIKKARGTEVVQEEGEAMQDGGDGGVVAVEDAAELQIDVRMDVSVLLCQSCLLLLKPPIFKCEAAGHILCCYCHGGHGAICSRADTQCPELDAVVSGAKVPCPYREFGCERYVAYHAAAEHQRACPCAPCSCPEPGCPFVGSPPALLDHFAAGHSRPVIAVRYGRPWNLSLPLAQRWHVVVAQEDRSVFLVCLGALDAAATAVSLVHVRADGADKGAPRFWCKLSVERPGEEKDKLKLVLMASTVSSSALTGGAPAPGQGMFLAVPQELLSGDMLPLSIRIDQLRPAAAAAKSTTLRAKGKEVVVEEHGMKRQKKKTDETKKMSKKWEAPAIGQAKLNVAGSYAADGSAGTGMVLRDSTGAVIYAACRQLFNCADAVEAELAALEEGLNLALHWTQLRFVAETDCSEVCELIKEETPNTSLERVRVIRELIKERDVKVAKIDREINCVSHELARFGRIGPKTAVWLGNFPRGISHYIAQDCNSINA